jgi:hypothetical protein
MSWPVALRIVVALLLLLLLLLLRVVRQLDAYLQLIVVQVEVVLPDSFP